MINYVIITSMMVNIFWSVQVEMLMKSDMDTLEISENSALRIKNGIRARRGQFPYQIAFRKTRKHIGYTVYYSFCGGSLIGDSKVLTAAHCFTDDKERTFVPTHCGFSGYYKRSYKGIYAVAGVINNKGRNPQIVADNGANQWREIYETKIPSDFEFPNHDIALVFTIYPFLFNKYVQPLPIATQPMDYGWMHCVASGYGRTDDYVKATHLMWAVLKLLPASTCSRIHKLHMTRFICTQPNITDVLKGDSGGPLVCNNTGDPADKGQGVIVGVVSGSRSGASTFFTRVTSYRDFIASNSKGSNSRTNGLRVLIVFCSSKSWFSFVIGSLTKIIAAFILKCNCRYELHNKAS